LIFNRRLRKALADCREICCWKDPTMTRDTIQEFGVGVP
jgi:hypothetical protein